MSWGSDQTIGWGGAPLPTGEGDMELIYSETLTSDAATITTGTLPTGFRSLVVDVAAKNDNSQDQAGALEIFFNNDLTQTNYKSARMLFAPSLSSVGVKAFEQDFPIMSSSVSSSSAPLFATTRIQIINHEQTNNYKGWQGVSQGMGSSAANRQIGKVVLGIWQNTNAITTLTVREFNGDSDLVAGSSLYVYG